MQNDFEAELLLETKNREDVIVAMGMMMDSPLPFENVSQSLESEVTLEGFLWLLLLMLLALLKIGLGIHKFLANEGRRLTTSSWKRTTIADRISSIRHLNSIRQRTVRELDRKIINDVSFTKFQVNRLTGE